jgi:hypothetical protein
MATLNMRTNENMDKVEEALKSKFTDVKAYQYNSGSIRIRVIDRRFKGKSNPERDAMVDPILDRLPVDIQRQITFLLLLAPSEAGGSLMNTEFDDPTPSRL